jgi:hypothetical protein
MLSDWLSDWWDEWGMLVVGILGAIAVFVVLVAAILAVSFHFNAEGCARQGEVQGVETSYHWTTGCLYVDPDYTVGT